MRSHGRAADCSDERRHHAGGADVTGGPGEDEAPAAEVGPQPVRAVGFLDLAGYTALTEVHGDQAAVDVVETFCDLVRASLSDGDVLVKSIGDAVLLLSPEAAALAELAGRVCAAVDAEPAFPVLRTGLHVGPVVLRRFDVFGGTVNVAARVAAQASGGQVLATRSFAEALGPSRWPVRHLGPRALKGLSAAVDVVELDLCPSPAGRAVDPVCGMSLLTGEGIEVAHARGPVRFCGPSCAARWSSAAPG